LKDSAIKLAFNLLESGIRHMMTGFLIVLALWTLAILALIARVRRGPAAFALLWGLVTPVLGITQTTAGTA
jgi:hypothetical protein